MKILVHPSFVKGTMRAAQSKSSMQRALAASLLINGTTTLHNPGSSNDDQAALNIIRQLGARIQMEDQQITIQSQGLQTKGCFIDCGESGLSVRMFTPIAALNNYLIEIRGSGSLTNRPLHFFDEVFPSLGVSIRSNGGKIPLQIKGPLLPQNITVDGSLSSQYLTGLLFAYAGAHARNITITVTQLNSKPYIDLTLHILRHFKLKTPTHTNYQQFYFDNSPAPPSVQQSIDYTIEGDWSGAAFFLVAGCIQGRLTITGLDLESTQADKKIIEALSLCGAQFQCHENQIEIEKSTLRPFTFDATQCPDLFPPLVALAAYCNGTSTIIGTERLTHKESNRTLSLQTQFAKMGVQISLQGNAMQVQSIQPIENSPCTVSSCHDHRIAMACAIAALGSAQAVVIEQADAVNKSYPNFYEQLKTIGASVVELSDSMTK